MNQHQIVSTVIVKHVQQEGVNGCQSKTTT